MKSNLTRAFDCSRDLLLLRRRSSTSCKRLVVSHCRRNPYDSLHFVLCKSHRYAAIQAANKQSASKRSIQTNMANLNPLYLSSRLSLKVNDIGVHSQNQSNIDRVWKSRLITLSTNGRKGALLLTRNQWLQSRSEYTLHGRRSMSSWRALLTRQILGPVNFYQSRDSFLCFRIV